MTQSHPLKGLRLGISASETVTGQGHGLTSRELNRAIRQVALAVLAQGGRLVFGHDWRSQGVMEEILDFAITYKPIAPLPEDEEPLITNYVAWPDSTAVSKEERAQYATVLRIVEPGKEHQQHFGPPRSGPAQKAARAAALTLMRRDMAQFCDARLCFGGKSSGSSGRYAGVAEEAAIALDSGCPLYVTSLFGGASEQVVQAILHRETGETPAFRPTTVVMQALDEHDPMPRAAVDPSIFTRSGLKELSNLNKLSVEENKRLFDARHLAEVIGLLLVGLARIQKERA